MRRSFFTAVLGLLGGSLLAQTKIDPATQIKPSPSSGAQVDNEIPQGSPNGTLNVFTLAAAPNPGNSLHVFNNGLRLTPGVDYSISTINPATFSFAPGAIPQTGDMLLADYRH